MKNMRSAYRRTVETRMRSEVEGGFKEDPVGKVELE